MDYIAYYKAYNLAFTLNPYVLKKKNSPFLTKNYKFNTYRYYIEKGNAEQNHGAHVQ